MAVDAEPNGLLLGAPHRTGGWIVYSAFQPFTGEHSEILQLTVIGANPGTFTPYPHIASTTDFFHAAYSKINVLPSDPIVHPIKRIEPWNGRA